jgi:hypothetical protein
MTPCGWKKCSSRFLGGTGADFYLILFQSAQIQYFRKKMCFKLLTVQLAKAPHNSVFTPWLLKIFLIFLRSKIVLKAPNI